MSYGGIVMRKSYMSTRDLCVVALFTALTAVMAQINLPMPYGVPMTMQTFAVALAGVALGARRGCLAIAVYVLLGFAGAPVFAKFAGGPGSVFGPTGGFIMSFPIMALTAGLGADRGGFLAMALGLFAGAVANFACGMLVYSLVTGNGWGVSFAACVLPFIPTAIIKAAAAGMIGVELRKRIIVPACKTSAA